MSPLPSVVPNLWSQNYMTRFARRAADVAAIEKEETRAAATATTAAAAAEATTVAITTEP